MSGAADHVPMTLTRNKEDRLFVRHGRRHYRPRHSMAEVRIGAAIVVGLALLAVWIAWKGAHPDPALFDVSATLLPSNPSVADRGPLPEGLAGTGWSAGPVSHFDGSNLYEKIDGREDFYKALGFEHLYFQSLASDEDPTATVDIELFDLGTAPNAIGAFAGERSADAPSVIAEGGLLQLARNALLMTRGRYYARAIGSEESPRNSAQLEHIKQTLASGLPAVELPWAYALFVGELGFDPGRISFTPENGYSLEFASNVYSALGDDQQTESFVIATADPSAARVLAARFATGLLEYGTAAGTKLGVEWVKDRYIGAVSGARAEGAFVVGIYGAPDVESAADALGSLIAGIDRLPAAELERIAREAAAPADAGTGNESTTSLTGDTESPGEY